MGNATTTHGMKAEMVDGQWRWTLDVDRARRRPYRRKLPSPDDPCELYRAYGADGALLYVGISASAIARMMEHRRSAMWWPEVRRLDIEPFATRTEAIDAEREAVASERPLFNVLLRGKSHSK